MNEKTLPHIKAKPGEIAENVIAVGDPGRVKILAELLDDYKVVNEHRGLLVITGNYKDIRVSIATHGMGCPSAAIVFEELGMLGARKITRLGTAGGMREDLEIGDIVVATGAAYTRGGCGLGQYMPEACAPTSPDPVLTTKIMEKLSGTGTRFYSGPVFSSDAFYAEDPGFAKKWSSRGVIAVEMEAAILFALGWMRGWRTAAVLVISDNLLSEKEEFATSEELKEKINIAAKAVLEAYRSLK
ncbi:purine-nucleoside phosphorylase [Staphylothermus hellenicus]|uniref:Purine or other phosphorylase family 1 n=1 Tax=Staphylothermus hellenicus (strain DSM 12710 / JCM 10830 / BK20S6-10-b1 / P8) TaxID=591019 RepID=D7DB70_STAHD|nr:purine-nucleoside phosphorylase [Staphylothermus hellenicus]ADI31417.1 purine or other phosphorylase family 1 [Staphylothermus hellenicus DSM 12710]